MLTQNRLKYQTNYYYLKKSYNNFENVNYGYAVLGENYKIQSFLYLKKKHVAHGFFPLITVISSNDTAAYFCRKTHCIFQISCHIGVAVDSFQQEENKLNTANQDQKEI